MSRSTSPPGSSAVPSTTASTAAGSVRRLGMIRWSRSMSAIGTRKATSTRPRTSAAVSAWCTATTAAKSTAVGRLDDRIARRDRLRAAATAPAQEQPRQHRDVVVGLDRRLARGAVRGRQRERHPAGQAPGDDVQERPDDQAEGGGGEKCGGHGHVPRVWWTEAWVASADGARSRVPSAPGQGDLSYQLLFRAAADAGLRARRSAGRQPPILKAFDSEVLVTRYVAPPPGPSGSRRWQRVLGHGQPW